MIAKIMAVFVVLLLLGGATTAASFQASSSVAVELADHPVDVVVVPVVPVLTTMVRHAITTVMPAIDEPVAFAFAPQTFRPPRG